MATCKQRLLYSSPSRSAQFSPRFRTLWLVEQPWLKTLAQPKVKVSHPKAEAKAFLVKVVDKDFPDKVVKVFLVAASSEWVQW